MNQTTAADVIKACAGIIKASPTVGIREVLTKAANGNVMARRNAVVAIESIVGDIDKWHASEPGTVKVLGVLDEAVRLIEAA